MPYHRYSPEDSEHELDATACINSLRGAIDDLTPPPFETPTWKWAIHNLVAHPLLVLIPPVGRILHDLTIDPRDDE